MTTLPMHPEIAGKPADVSAVDRRAQAEAAAYRREHDEIVARVAAKKKE